LTINTVSDNSVHFLKQANRRSGSLNFKLMGCLHDPANFQQMYSKYTC